MCTVIYRSNFTNNSVLHPDSDWRAILEFMALLFFALFGAIISQTVVYNEYVNLCSQYAIKDPLCSRIYIRESVWNAFCNCVL